MPLRVYVETSVVSYFAARLSTDVVMAGHQRTTQQWWEYANGRHDLVISQAVIAEAALGDPTAAAERLEILSHLHLLNIGDEAQTLADHLVASGAIPPSAATDALHIGIAATNGVNYLITWNFKHLANPAVRARIELESCKAGYESPTICTPEEMLEARL